MEVPRVRNGRILSYPKIYHETYSTLGNCKATIESLVYYILLLTDIFPLSSHPIISFHQISGSLNLEPYRMISQLLLWRIQPWFHMELRFLHSFYILQMYAIFSKSGIYVIAPWNDSEAKIQNLIYCLREFPTKIARSPFSCLHCTDSTSVQIQFNLLGSN